MHRYVTLKYNHFWTTLLDNYLRLKINNQDHMLKWGAEEFNKPIENCKNRFLKPIIKAMKNLTELFVMPPESGDNMYIYQPILRERNLQLIRKQK